MTNVSVLVARLPHGNGIPLPVYATELSAGADLQAAVDDPLTLTPGARAIVPTGLSISVPTGYEAQIRPRSGLAINHGVTVLNSPGTIDASSYHATRQGFSTVSRSRHRVPRSLR